MTITTISYLSLPITYYQTLTTLQILSLTQQVTLSIKWTMDYSKNTSLYLSNIFQVPGFRLSTLHSLSCLIITRTYFTKMEIESWRDCHKETISGIPKEPQLRPLDITSLFCLLHFISLLSSAPAASHIGAILV